jgi:hypothetical protein
VVGRGRNQTFHDCVKKIRSREQDLLKDGADSLLKARRFKSKEESDAKSKGTSTQMIPSIPGFILHKVKPENIKKDLIRWRGIYNYEMRIIRADECAARPCNDENQDDGVQKNRSRTTAQLKDLGRNATSREVRARMERRNLLSSDESKW